MPGPFYVRAVSVVPGPEVRSTVFVRMTWTYLWFLELKPLLNLGTILVDGWSGWDGDGSIWLNRLLPHWCGSGGDNHRFFIAATLIRGFIVLCIFHPSRVPGLVRLRRRSWFVVRPRRGWRRRVRWASLGRRCRWCSRVFPVVFVQKLTDVSGVSSGWLLLSHYRGFLSSGGI